MRNVYEYCPEFENDKYLLRLISTEDTMQLVLEAETEEEKDFYELVGDYLLQKKQKKVMEGNLF